LKNTILCILFCVPFFISAQRTTYVELGYGLHQYSNDIQLEESTAQGYFDFRQGELGRITPSAHLAISTNLYKSLSFKSGLGFGSYRFWSDSGVDLGNQRQLERVFVSVPLLVKAEFFKDKWWIPYIETGVLGSYLVNETTRVTDFANNVVDGAYRRGGEVDYNPLIFSTLLNVGVSRRMSSKSFFFVEAHTAYQLNKIQELGVSERVSRLGFNVGMKIRV